MKNALSSAKEVDNIRALQILTAPEIWSRVLEMVCGKVRDHDIEVQQEIWLRLLKGPLQDVGGIPRAVRVLDPMLWIPWVFPLDIFKFWTLYMLDLSKGCQTLAVNHYKYPHRDLRVIYVIIIFLGPFSKFGLDDGIHWNYGPRAKRVRGRSAGRAMAE